MKIVLVVLGLWVWLTVLGVSLAHSANNNKPQPKLTAIVRADVQRTADQVGGNAKAGHVACIGPIQKYTYVCTVNVVTAAGKTACAKFFIAWKGYAKFDAWPVSWACKAKRPKLPPIPYKARGVGA